MGERIMLRSIEMNRLQGKVAVITGGTTGIGFATAEQFVREGARVIITGQDDARLRAAAQALGGDVATIRTDVRVLTDLDALAQYIEEQVGTIDILFANAGVGAFAPVAAIDEAFFDAQFDVNVKGAFFTVQRVQHLLSNGASIILNASAVHEKGMAMGSVYVATKAAVRSLARTLAAELAPRQIRVNAVSPGYVETAFQSKMGLPADALDGFAAMITQATPLKRTGTPQEIALAVVFLASDEASYVTGEDLVVDGGFMHV